MFQPFWPGPRATQDLLSQVGWLFIVWVTVGRPLCPLIAELMAQREWDPKFLNFWGGSGVTLQIIPVSKRLPDPRIVLKTND